MVCYPFIPCPQCKSPNDTDYKFCKSCGLQRIIQTDNTVRAREENCDLRLIDDRIKYLDSLIDSSCYTKQKSHLKTELSEFLSAIDPQKNLYNAVPEDLRKFIIMKEKGGRTQLHNASCHFKGLAGKQTCSCPKTLAAKSVDSLIGKMRAIFRDLGRTGDWNPISLTGNPASSLLMKRHLRSVTVEQTSASVVSKQAVPLMFDKLGKLCRYLTYQVSVEKDHVTKLLWLRDKAYFAMLCHSGDRGGDLGLLTADRIFQLPDSDGIFISEVAGKTASIDNPKNAVLLPSKDTDICPIKHLRMYFDFAEKTDIKLNEGYIFRIRDVRTKQITDKPVNSSCMSERLKTHLLAINLYEGESSHSSRRSCAITLRMLGADDGNVNQHLGWTSKHMLNHYATIGGLCSPKGAASMLSHAADKSNNDQSKLGKVSKSFQGLKHMKHFYFTAR